MENVASKSKEGKTRKIVTGLFLFCYFGFTISPELSRSNSTLFILWHLLLPIVLITLVVIGFQAGIGIWREKTGKSNPNLQNKYYGWLAVLGLLWFAISGYLSNITYNKYAHQKFDSETWKDSNTNITRRIQLSPRQRMSDDLINNVLPRIKTKTEMLDLLGQPNEQRKINNEESFIYYYGPGFFDIACIIINFDDVELIKDYHISECG